MWYVLEGDYRFKVGEAMFRVSEGGMAFGPRGAPHGFQNIGDTPGRLLVIATPSGRGAVLRAVRRAATRPAGYRGARRHYGCQLG